VRYLYILSYYNQLKIIMCGINRFTFSDQDLIKKMMVYTKNRGPDANGIYHDTDLTMSHDRLSIIDLNEGSNQSMKFKNDIHQLVRKKWGLQSPYAKWMKGPLQNFLFEVLIKDYYNNSKYYFNFDKLHKLIKIHKEKYYNPDLLWSLIMMQMFLKNFKL